MNGSGFFASLLLVIVFQTVGDAETFYDARSNFNSNGYPFPNGLSRYNNNSPLQQRPPMTTSLLTNPQFSAFPRTYNPPFPNPSFRNIPSSSFGGTGLSDNFRTFASSPLLRPTPHIDEDSSSVRDSSGVGGVQYARPNSMTAQNNRNPVFIPSRAYLLATSGRPSGNSFPYPYNTYLFPKPLALTAGAPYPKPIACCNDNPPVDSSDEKYKNPSLSSGNTAAVAAVAVAGAAVGAAAATKPTQTQTQPSPGNVAGATVGAASTLKPTQSEIPTEVPDYPGVAAPKPDKGEQPTQSEDKCNWCIRKNCNPGGCMEVANFDPKKDAEALHKAMQNKDEEGVIDILTHRSDGQIKKIKQEYQVYASALTRDISKSKFKTKDLLLALLKPRATYFAEELHNALKKRDIETMIMILTSLSPCAIQKVGVAYNLRFGEEISLAKGIEDVTSDNFEAFLRELSRGNRTPDGPVNIAEAKKDAEALLNAGPNKWFRSDKSVFIDIFTHRSYSQLRQIIESFNEMRKPKSDIWKDIRANTRDELQRGLTVMMQNVDDQPGYFANELEGSLDKIFGSSVADMDKLVRIMRGRCGIDLGDIRDAYPKNHSGKILSDRLANKKGVEYVDALLAMLREPQTQGTNRTP